MRAIRPIMTSLLAAAVGAGAALLFAPQSGARTRRQIKHKTEDLLHNVAEDVTASADDAVERGKLMAHELGRRFRSRLKPKVAGVVPR